MYTFDLAAAVEVDIGWAAGRAGGLGTVWCGKSHCCIVGFALRSLYGLCTARHGAGTVGKGKSGS